MPSTFTDCSELRQTCRLAVSSSSAWIFDEVLLDGPALVEERFPGFGNVCFDEVGILRAALSILLHAASNLPYIASRGCRE